MAIVNAWRLNGNSTNQGGGTNGTDSNITYTNDYASFNGSTSLITCGTAIQPGTADFVVSLSFRSTSTGTTRAFISNNNGGNYYSFWYRNAVDGRVGQDIFANTVNADVSSNNGKWRRVSFCRLSNTSAIFVDGKEYAGSSAGANSGTGGNTVIGGRPFDANFRYSGDMKWIIHTNSTLRKGEIVNDNLLYKGFF